MGRRFRTRTSPVWRAPLAAVGLVLVLAGRAGSAAEVDPCAGVSAPVWTGLRYSASKLFLSATATTSVVFRSADATRPELAVPPVPERARPASPCVAIVTLETDVPFGRDEIAKTWLDPRTGAVQQIDKTALGHGSFHKTLRFLTSGIFVWRAAPAERSEESLPVAQWTRRKQYEVVAGSPLPENLALTDAYALLYLLSTSHLDRPDASRSFVIFADDRPALVRMTAGSLTQQPVDVEERWPGGARRRRASALVREVRVSGTPLDDAHGKGDGVNLGFLGMRGDLTVFVEVGTQLPVMLTGRADAVGRLVVRLDGADLCAEPGSGPGAVVRQSPTR